MMIRHAYSSATLVALALWVPLVANGQVTTRSNEIGQAQKESEVAVGRYLFAGIGINDYQSPELWKRLDNAVNDVDLMWETLRDEFDFESDSSWILRDAHATQIAIRALIDELGRTLEPDDNLVFFYAGHGAERATIFDGEVVSRTGYIVPVGVKATLEEAASQYLEIDRLLADLAALPARHVLLILDSCYSGLALEGDFKSRGGELTQQAHDLIGRRSRRVLTSAQSDQLAADGGADFPNNSLFTGWLTEGLRRASQGVLPGRETPDTDDDGLMTVTELFSFVSRSVGGSSGSRQTPDFGAFKFDDRGELVLARETHPFDDAYRAALDAFAYAKFDAFFAASEEALAAQPVGPRSSFLRYTEARINDELLVTLTALRELAAFAAEGETVPLDAGGLMIELGKAERQCKKVDCEVTPGN